MFRSVTHVFYLMAFILLLAGCGSSNSSSNNDESGNTVIDSQGTNVTSISLHATFHSIGIQVDIEGDDNNNATAVLEANINGQGFVKQHDLSKVFLVTTPSGQYPQRFVGSVFSVDPNTTVDVRVTISDPDGTNNSVQQASITTRKLVIPTSTGTEYHVATTGDNSATGTAGLPFLTIQHGVNQLQPGDSLLIHAGTYHESIDLNSIKISESQEAISIKSAGDGDVILDGTDPLLNDGSVWTNEGGNVYSATLNSPNNESYYVGFDGNRLWKYLSLTDLQSLKDGTNGGFFTDANSQKVYAIFTDNQSPVGHQITVSNKEYAFDIFEVNNLVIDSLIFKNFNGGEHSAAIKLSEGAYRVWITNNSFQNMETPIRLEQKVIDTVVMGNSFSDQGIQAFNWDIVKANQYWLERGSVFCSNDEYSGYGTVFYDNDVNEMFDGIKIVGNEILTYASNADVINNRFKTLSDDGVETDGYSSNVRILDNRFEKMLIGVSVAPALAGPTYIVRNLMVDLQNTAGSDYATGAVKFSIGDDVYGDIFIYHNTGATTEANREAFSVSNEADWTSLVMKNNIWSGESYGIYYYLDNAADLKVEQDYDLLYASSGLAAQYQGEDYADIADYINITGYCTQCIEASPQFVDQSNGDYSLQSSSPAINAAELIPGINTLDSNGNNPDMGAIEFSN